MIIDPYTWHAATIDKIVHESVDAISVRLAISGYHYKCGQYAIVRVTVGATRLLRQYSFSSAPGSGETWLTITLTPGGEVSTWFVRHAKAGDTVDITPPFASPLEFESPPERLCLIGGGSGIAPLMSHLRHRREHHVSITTLLYSTRSTTRCFEDELAQPRPNETITVHISDTHGRLTDTQIAHAVHGADAVLICGSRSFIGSVKEIAEHHIDPRYIRSEAFTL